MSQTSSSETPVTKLARFIVDKRKAFFLVFLAAVLFCGSSIDKVVVNNDITSYLPAETETRRGLTLMDEEFTTYASAQVMLSNVTYRQAEKVAAQLAELDGVSSVAFDDSTDHFKDSSALFSVSFTGEEGSPEADAALAAVKELVAPYDHYVFPSGDPYDSDSLMQEMTVILAIAAAVIVAVLLFTSKSYLEVLVFSLCLWSPPSSTWAPTFSLTRFPSSPTPSPWCSSLPWPSITPLSSATAIWRSGTTVWTPERRTLPP